MRETKFRRLTALLLCLSMLIGSATVFVSAAETGNGTSTGNSQLTDVSLAEIKELLNAISYEEYALKNVEIPAGEKSISVDVFDYELDYDGADESELEESKLFREKEIDGIKVLYTPQDGTVTWSVEVPETAKYGITIEYYPDQNRTTAIERILQINKKVPFAEARYLSFSKNWNNSYSDAIIEPSGKKSADSIKSLALDSGFVDVYVNDDGNVVIPRKGNEIVTAKMTEFFEDYDVRFFLLDIHSNELRPVAVEAPKWMTYYLKDSTGYYSENFEVVFDEGVNTITLEGKSEPMSIKSITLTPIEDVESYEDYAERYKDAPAGSDVILLEAEHPTAMSNKTIYPIEDRSCAINSPTSNERTLLNTLGGEKWATAGQWVEYTFSVETSGMYDVISRFRQNVLDGMYTCRAFTIYSEGLDADADGYYNGAPFEEALKMVYDYSDEWQVTALSSGVQYDSDGNGKINSDDDDITYPIYLSSDAESYTIRLEVTLGRMGDIVREVEDILQHVNDDYLAIIKLTGTTPDKYRDYGFNTIMLPVLKDMVIQSRRLTAIAEELTEIAGEKSSNVGTLQKISRLLEEMGQDEDEIAKNLNQLKTHIGTLGTFLSDVQTQPLQLDYLLIQPAGEDMPAATPNFFQAFGHEIVGFFTSFWRNYDDIGILTEVEEDATEVWLATGRDQFQVIRNLVNNDFTKATDIPIDLKLVANGTLLPSILAGSGPDVYLGLASGEVINYAIRSAILNIEKFDDFEEFTEENFNDAAMYVLGIEDADENYHCYALPETQSFSMMFVRIDILADMGREIPTTWDELEALVPDLQSRNMQIGLPTDSQIFLYQAGGELFADYGMRINLDSPVGGATFEKMCNLFTMYSYPYSYNAANRFRTGEMPIVIGDYVATYNQLKVFATEIEGLWNFYPMPGTVDENGNINNCAVSAVTAVVMVKGCEEGTDQERAWEFMKWYTGSEFQQDYANEMVAIMGPSAKSATANIDALRSMPWTTDELNQILAQFNNLASIPNYPGSYIIARYTNFAFLNAYNNKADPIDSLNSYINTINKEIARKRDEFQLETLTEGDNDYKDLVTKRTAQLERLVGYIKDNTSDYNELMDEVLTALKSEDLALINLALANVLDAYNELDPDGSKFEADRNKVMGYDMSDTTLTKDQKKALRKCFSYEVYENTEEVYTQLRCCADFLADVADLMTQN